MATQEYVVNGVCYKGIKAIARSKDANPFGLSDTAIAKRIKKGMTPEQALSFSNVYVVNGICYRNLGAVVRSETANTLRLSYSTVKGRVKRGMTIEEALSLPTMDNPLAPKECIVNDTIYKSRGLAMRDPKNNPYGLSSAAIYQEMGEGLTFGEAMSSATQKHEKFMVKPFAIQGRTYDSYKAAIEDTSSNPFNVKSGTVRTRMFRKGMSIEEALAYKPVMGKIKIRVCGIEYESLTQAVQSVKANPLHLSYTCIKYRIKRIGMPIDEAFSIPPHAIHKTLKNNDKEKIADIELKMSNAQKK